jgi:presenilin-like A22 family membrane protease
MLIISFLTYIYKVNRKQVVPHTYILKMTKLIVFYDFFIFMNWHAKKIAYTLSAVRSTNTILYLLLLSKPSWLEHT